MRRCKATLSFKTARTVALTYLRCHFATAAKVRNPPNVLNDYVCFGLGTVIASGSTNGGFFSHSRHLCMRQEGAFILGVDCDDYSQTRFGSQLQAGRIA
jgi:hypothetical protein